MLLFIIKYIKYNPTIVGSLETPYFLAFSLLGISIIFNLLLIAHIKISISMVNPFCLVFIFLNSNLVVPFNEYRMSVNLVLNNLLNKITKKITPEALTKLENPASKSKS